MKKLLLGTLALSFFSCSNPNEIDTEFKVYGNCMMCEKTIEGSLNGVDGLSIGDWDKNSKIIKVKYDTTKLTLDQIKGKIAGVGYDMEDVRAEDKVYDQLHGCCKYKRPE